MVKRKADNLQFPQKSHPGKAGSKRRLTGGHKVGPYLDDGTIVDLTKLGNGTLSSGIRKARKIVNRLPPKAIAAIVKIDDLHDPDTLDMVLDEIMK